MKEKRDFLPWEQTLMQTNKAHIGNRRQTPMIMYTQCILVSWSFNGATNKLVNLTLPRLLHIVSPYNTWSSLIKKNFKSFCYTCTTVILSTSLYVTYYSNILGMVKSRWTQDLSKIFLCWISSEWLNKYFAVYWYWLCSSSQNYETINIRKEIIYPQVPFWRVYAESERSCRK